MKPLKPGFYYYRHPGAPLDHIWVSQVVNTRGAGLFASVYASIPEHRIEHRSIHDLGGEWFGPLPSPESMGA